MRMYYGGGGGGRAHLLNSFFLLGLVRLVELLLELVDLSTLFHTGGGGRGAFENEIECR